MKDNISFSKYIENKIIAYKVMSSLLFSLVITLCIVTSVGSLVNKNKNTFIGAMAPHLSTLIEIQDTPQMIRFIKSLAEKENIFIEVMQNGKIISSTLDISRIGEESDISPSSLWGITYTSKYLVNHHKVARNHGPQNLNAQVMMLTPLSGLFWGAAFVALFSFVISYCLVSFLVSLMKSVNEHLADSKAKELLMASHKGLIHDLHTPISALKLWIKVLNKDNIPLEKKEYARKNIVKLAEQVLNQIRSSKSQLGVEVKIQKKKDLRGCLKQASENVDITFSSNKNIKMITHIDERVVANYDPILLGRAIQNLLVNAFEACNKQVALSLSQHKSGQASIKVSDDGGGLSEEEVSLYLQGRGQSTKSEREGIGLPSAHHIVRSHGGKIIYERSHLGGACFEIRI